MMHNDLPDKPCLSGLNNVRRTGTEAGILSI